MRNLYTGILESRVPGLLRLLFRLNALEFFEYRISYTVHMLSWSGQSNYEPRLQFERNTAKTIAGCRQRGTVINDLSQCCIPDKYSSSGERKGKQESVDDESSCSAFTLKPVVTPKDHALLLRRAKSQLYTLLQNSTSCTAMRYNVEAISKLMPFMTEYTAHMEKKETICDRILDSYLTKAFFWALGDREVRH